MKRILIAIALVASASTAALAADVGVSVSVGQPGFYGRVDIGGFPPPQLIYEQPRYIERVPVGRPPIYLRVPPGHIKHWGQHCREYHACGEPVYFVRDDWYRREYVPRYQEHRVDYRDDRYRDDRHDRYRDDYRRDDHRGDDRNDNRGHDNGRGHGHDR